MTPPILAEMDFSGLFSHIKAANKYAASTRLSYKIAQHALLLLLW